jgi:DNA/RNA-binding domain of Phe-tRNA-synthetase-like protein
VKAKELELKVLEDERIEIENTLQKLTEKELVQSFQVNWKKIKNKIQQIRSDIEEIREDVSSFEL